MKPVTLSFSLAALLSASMIYAAPIFAVSELEVNHSFVINSGTSSDGIDISFGPNPLTIDRDAATSLTILTPTPRMTSTS